MEDIYFTKKSKNLHKPQVYAAFLSYLHIHFNSSTLISFVTVLNVADYCSAFSFRTLSSLGWKNRPFAL